MPTILDTIAAHARERVRQDQAFLPLEALQAQALRLGPGGGNAFLQGLRRPGLSFICEVKKASPSKGLISPDFPYLDIAGDYAAAGADAISCLTEPKWFLGSDEIFAEIRQAVTTPMLRKDFTVEDYQLYQARVLGANAVLLIVALHDADTLAHRLELCRQLGLAALVETHDSQEIETALAAGAEILGVNNRNLKDFSVDFENAARLRDQIPPEVIYVAESGVSGPEDVRRLKQIGADAALIGEALMRAPDRRLVLQQFKEAAQ
ncbi:MAG: indole-3-glycerol phosphate synthase TrpC [Clostridia bacterium]|nr:indole-3-glycerol phosphate synthase TrpC [Clostridia bacterium]